MLSEPFHTLFDLATAAALLFGYFFMFVGSLGLVRLPDFYNRVHAASKPVTLGITGMMLAVVLFLATVPGVNMIQVVTKVALAVVFIVVAVPVGSHLIAKAAHEDQCPKYPGTIGDEFEADQRHRR